MSRDDIIRMARHAGLIKDWMALRNEDSDALARFAALVAAAEREACASMFANEDCLFEGRHIAVAIRARG
jgi:hypothetical protein